MIPIVRRLLTVTALFSMCSYAALADVVGSATTIADIDIGGHIAGTTTFVDETRNVFGTPVNLGSAGTLTLTGQVTSGTPIPFTVRTVGSPLFALQLHVPVPLPVGKFHT